MGRTLSARLKPATHVLATAFARLSPHTGKLSLDLLLLLVIGALHHVVVPSLLGRVLVVDLMTPWLVASFVAARLPHAAAMCAVGAVILETSSAAPAGLYLSAYWVILVVLYLTRATLSWRHAFPWLVTIGLAELWVIAFEVFVTFVNEGGMKADSGFIFAQTLRVLLALAFGLVASRRLRSFDFMDQPQGAGLAGRAVTPVQGID